MIIHLKQGSLEGKICKSVLTEEKYYGFFGIPYAKPPIGQFRFKESVPLQEWTGILDATKPGNDCTQLDFMTNKVQGKEDCLFLNVYTPKADERSLKPVMVFIHSGGYETGTGSEEVYGADYLLNYDVVLVAIHYRLHALGFLNLGIPECPGNVGMKDQVLALKWIKNNIRSFGGDNGNITLFGISAGAASAHLHMISPLSKGLFNRCIMQSGSSLCPWSYTREPEKYAYLLGKELGYKGPENSLALVNFLKTVDGSDIVTAVKRISLSLEDPISLGFHFIPSLEKIKEGAFLPEEPEMLLKSADPLPVIIGLDEKEFLLFHVLIENLRKGAENAGKSLTALVNRVMDDWKLDKKYLEQVVDKVKALYFGNSTTKEEIDKKTIDLFSDLTFGTSLYRSIDHILHSSNPVYVYQFTFLGTLNLLKLMAPQMEAHCTTHGDDLPYLFYSHLFKIDKELSKKEPEKTVIENMCKLWTNFAKTGNPNGSNVNVEWIPSTVEKPTYLEINSTLMRKEGRIDDDRVTFWENIIRDYKVV